MATSSGTASRPLVTVQRAVAVLETLAETSDDLGTSEVARRTGINASTVSRLLATLAQDDLVRRVTETGRWRLGPRLISLGNAALARVDLRQLARSHLVALTEDTGETATLSVPGERAAMTVDFVQSPASVRSVARIGRPSVGHATATGKVSLAYGGQLPPGKLEAYTARTITDRGRLTRELERTRRRGWARAAGERETDLNAVAAPILGAEGHLLGILGVQGPAGRFDEQAMRAAVAALLEHTDELSSGLAA